MALLHLLSCSLSLSSRLEYLMDITPRCIRNRIRLHLLHLLYLILLISCSIYSIFSSSIPIMNHFLVMSFSLTLLARILIILLFRHFQIFIYELFIFIALLVFLNYELIYVIFNGHYELFGTYQLYLVLLFGFY